MTTTRATRTLGIDGTKLTLDGEPFFYQGLNFFNALYNPEFNRSDADRRAWVRKFKANGVNCLRIWLQWDFPPPMNFADLGPGQTMYADDGAVKDEPFERLAALLKALDDERMILNVSMFAHERIPYFLPVKASERASRELTDRLRPYGNLFQQIWSESNHEVRRYLAVVRETDPDRLVTNAPGFNQEGRPFDHVGLEDDVNRALDILTPHTLRAEGFPFWYLAPAQVEYLVDTYGKPVIDDSPARHGPMLYGGIVGGTTPEQHITHAQRTRAAGGYHCYQHDMFQYGYEHELTSPNGIPDPDYSPFHRQVFDYLRDHPTWEVTRR